MKKVFLTIDDGPSERCAELVDFLSAHGIGAVLFCRGDNLKQRPKLVINAVKAGFIIGNHSWSHADFNKLDEKQAREEITKTDEVINEIYREAGVTRPAKWFRFPYGHDGKTPRQKRVFQKILKELGYWNPLDASRADWHWDCDVEDWHTTEENAVAKLALAKKRLRALPDGGILDIHDHEANSRLKLLQAILKHALHSKTSFHSNEEIRGLSESKQNDLKEGTQQTQCTRLSKTKKREQQETRTKKTIKRKN